MAIERWIQTVAAVAVFSSLTGSCASDCSDLHLGVRSTGERKGKILLSTARAPFSSGSTDTEGSEEQATLLAKGQLLKHLGLQKSEELRGAFVRSVCRRDGFVYVVVELSEASAKAAGSLKERMQASVNRAPTP